MAVTEIVNLSTLVDRALTKIDEALDAGNQRDFVKWCLRRAALIARREKALVAEATAPIPA